MKFYTSLLVSLLFLSQIGFAAVNTLSLSASSAKDCDTVTVTMVGTHFCPNDFITGISHTVSGSTITVTIGMSFGFCIPPMTPPAFTANYSLPLNGVAVGSYTVRAIYSTTLSTSTAPLTVSQCCPAIAKAGKDTAMCNTNSIVLKGNSPPSGSTASWSVITGSGTLSGSTQPNATLSNLSYGLNEVVWTMVHPTCTTKDTLKITNYEPPTTAITEADRVSCSDTTTVKANAVTVGSGSWVPITAGVILAKPNNSQSLATFSSPGTYHLIWNTSNGLCQSEDTLSIDYVALTDTPKITKNNLILSSSSAPLYQWYKDGVAIPGQTSNTLTVTENGVYKVLGSEPQCSSGLFSNEIEFLTIGMEANLPKNLHLSPNPSSGVLVINGLKGDEEIILYQMDGKQLRWNKTTRTRLELDYSDLKAGLYLIQIQSANESVFKRLVLTE